MGGYRPDATPLRFAAPSVLLGLLGAAAAIPALPLWLIVYTIYYKSQLTGVIIAYVLMAVMLLAMAFTFVSIFSICLAIIAHVSLSDSDRLRYMVRRGLCCPAYGNPLNFKAGELLPIIVCHCVGDEIYHLTVKPLSRTIEDVEKISMNISGCLRGRFSDYAVTLVNASVSCDYVTFTLENVVIDRSITAHSVRDLCPGGPTQLIVQNGTYIDLTTSGSILAAGKTRSGKTTAIISLLLQSLLEGRDNYGSEILIIDPKRAELSRLPHVVTLDEDGEATGILEALRAYTQTIVKRQQILNDLSEQSGDAVHWWEAGFHPSFVFIDEYVACRTLFPKRAPKGNEDYCLTTFDGLIKRIVTMGASAGCYSIISIAEASVEDGGLPSMLRSAMSTKILMRPTMPEAQLLWPTEKLKALAIARVYRAGDAWFSSTDGEHDDVSYVHFPRMRFRAYRELRRQLNAYYGD